MRSGSEGHEGGRASGAGLCFASVQQRECRGVPRVPWSSMSRQILLFINLLAVVGVLTAIAATSGAEVASTEPEVAAAEPEVMGSSHKPTAGGGDMASPGRRKEWGLPDDSGTQPKHVLPINKQVSAFLPGGHYKRFLYRLDRAGSPISLIITPCSSALRGDIFFYPDKVRGVSKPARVVRRLDGPEQVIYSERRGQPGSYDMNITAFNDTYVHFLAADEDLASLGALQTNVKVKVQSRNRAEISWAPGSYRGEALRYCLITSPTRHFSTVCGALSAKFGLQPPGDSAARRRRAQAAPPSRRERRRAVEDRNIVMGCVGRATVYTLHDLVPGPRYRVTVFGHYRNRDVSFSYGTGMVEYGDASESSLTIRQGQVTNFRLSSTRRLRRLQLRLPRASRRKSEKKDASGRRLFFYVTSCGAGLRVCVLPGPGRMPIGCGDVSGGGLFTSHFDATKARYQFEFEATGGATSVEFQATWRRRRLRLATLPDRPRVRRVGERRRRKLELGCGELALTMPRSRGRRLEYCVVLEEDRTGRTGRVFKQPSVCRLDRWLELSPANLTRCGTNRQLRRGKRVEVLFDGLIPGQTYVARAMVRPVKGRFLPYNLHQVTVPECADQLPNELPENKSEPMGEASDDNRNTTSPHISREASEEAQNKLD